MEQLEALTYQVASLEKKIERLESIILSEFPKSNLNLSSKWCDEDTAMALLGVSKKSLQILRRNGEINVSTASGKNIKYLKTDLERYMDKNSTVKSLRKA